MSGVYTNLAKKRVQQSMEPPNQSSIPPLSATPVVEKAPDKKEKPASTPARTPAKLSPGLADLEKPEKYTTHIEPSLMKKIKLWAVEKDMKDYDVVRAVLIQYFENNK
jgi:hypothetical protein